MEEWRPSSASSVWLGGLDIFATTVSGVCMNSPVVSSVIPGTPWRRNHTLLGGTVITSLPVQEMQETRVRSLGQEEGEVPREGNCNSHQYSCLGNPMDRGMWWTTVH